MIARTTLTGIAAVLLAPPACAQAPAPPQLEIRDVRLGETLVQLAVTGGQGPGLDYLVLHDDENTAVEAGLEAVRRHGGRLVELRAQGERNVVFTVAGRRFRFDPNRAFTDAGAAATLAAQSPAHRSRAALAAVRGFAGDVVEAYLGDATGFVVTLHNNTDGGYSAASYAPGGSLAGDAADVHLPAGADPDDFFFVTTRELFDALAGRGFAVVLQDNEAVTNDGSLSVWAGRRGLPYVNVEAQHGKVETQIEMLEALREVAGGR